MNDIIEKATRDIIEAQKLMEKAPEYVSIDDKLNHGIKDKAWYANYIKEVHAYLFKKSLASNQ